MSDRNRDSVWRITRGVNDFLTGLPLVPGRAAVRTFTDRQKNGGLSPLTSLNDTLQDLRRQSGPPERVQFSASSTRNPMAGRIPSRTDVRAREQASTLAGDVFAGLAGPRPTVGAGDVGGGFARAEQTLSGYLRNLDATYQAKRSEIQAMYQLAETPEEQARLAFVLGDLEEQRKAGTQIIADQYAQAQRYAQTQSTAMRDTAATEGAAIGDVYRDAASRTAAGIDAVAGEFTGTGIGVGAQPMSGDAADWIGLLEAAAPREQALTQQLGSIAADDMAFLAGQLGGEGAAQQGALQRAALGIRADEIARHQQNVADRVNAERMAQASALTGLQSQFLGRQFGLQDQTVGVQTAAADRAFDVAMSDRRYAQDQQAAYDRDMRDFVLGEHVRSQSPAVDAVPTSLSEQLMFVGQLLSNDPVNGPNVLRGLIASGAIPASVAAYFEGSL